MLGNACHFQTKICFKELFSGISVKISNCWAFSLFEIVPGSQIRSVSITERYMIAYSSSDTLSTVKKINF